MILDKLIEKKDIYAYCIARKRKLTEHKKQIFGFPAKNRNVIYHGYESAQKELEMLCNHLRANSLKENSKALWRKSK